jgi:hypothetical protein
MKMRKKQESHAKGRETAAENDGSHGRVRLVRLSQPEPADVSRLRHSSRLRTPG